MRSTLVAAARLVGYFVSRGMHLSLEPVRCRHAPASLDGAGQLVQVGDRDVRVRQCDGLRHGVGREVQVAVSR